MNFTDEELGAYLDGEADETLRGRIDAALEHDPTLEQRLAGLDKVDGLLKAAVEPASAALPPGLADAARRLSEAQAATTVVAFRPRAAAARTGGWFSMPSALAASIALVVGAGAGAFLLAPAGGGSNPGIARAGEPLHMALQTTPSGEAWRGEMGEVRPILSFRDAAGRACREFELRSADAASVGVACADEGNWRIEALLAAAPAPPSDDGYRPASGVNAAALDAVLGRLMQGDALDEPAERALLEKGWR